MHGKNNFLKSSSSCFRLRAFLLVLGMTLVSAQYSAAETTISKGKSALTNIVETAPSQRQDGCSSRASAACFFKVTLQDGHQNGGTLGYYASHPIDHGNTNYPKINSALIVIHGHSHDAAKTFDSAIAAASADELATTLVIAPLFQAGDANAKKCRSAESPSATSSDFVWTCTSWMEGGPSQNDPDMTSFKAIDQLIETIIQHYPAVRTITIAGFSAGAQTVQHYIGFSTLQPKSYSVRYVVADPGTWLYFDAERPQPMIKGQPVTWSECDADGQSDFGKCTVKVIIPSQTASDCPAYNAWKYGTDNLPSTLPTNATAGAARLAYQAADVTYLEAALDSSNHKNAAYKVLDKSCGAALQGPFRLHRGLAYALYEQEKLQSPHHRMMKIVPDCGHDVACVFPSDIGRKALFPTTSLKTH
ncbi:hypothetical protein [Glaciimonas sp. PAMC28666]|uniref:hypothetical protein n=1 Tax=Glaciimonas sp. PAMC28666 TaxID=2807626 RepID=UPI001964B7C1|nr:hypothetical protein [Glaciimonas sp. PAMC28666]QRX82532.1 hypothetical protein JQN73_21085 [Glaciimonas sp. PAMC28666]